MGESRSWIVDAYPLPFVPLGRSPWTPATVEVWEDRVVVQLVATAASPGQAPWSALARECEWTLRYDSGAAAPLWAGRADDGEGMVRCYLLFGDRHDSDIPVALVGHLDGDPVEADLRRTQPARRPNT